MRVLSTFSSPLVTPPEGTPEPEVAGSNPAARAAFSLSPMFRTRRGPSEPPETGRAGTCSRRDPGRRRGEHAGSARHAAGRASRMRATRGLSCSTDPARAATDGRATSLGVADPRRTGPRRVPDVLHSVGVEGRRHDDQRGRSRRPERPWPIAPGSSVSLEPGDEGTGRNVSRKYRAVEPDDRGDDWWDDINDRLSGSDRRG